MSYAAAPTFEGNYFGVRRLSTLGNAGLMLGGLGATPGDYDNNQQVLGALVAMGAITQQDASDIWDGQASLDDMAVNMTMINQALQIAGQPGAQIVNPLPAGINPAVAPPPPPTSPGSVSYALPASSGPAAQAQPQSPLGSTLIYNASWSAGVVAAAVATAIVVGSGQAYSALSALQNLLPGTQAKLISGNATSNGPMTYSISVTVQDTAGHAKITDLQGVLDAIVKQSIGASTINSSLSMLSVGTGNLATSSGGTPQPPQSLTQWFEANAGYIGIGVAALVVVGIVWGGRR